MSKNTNVNTLGLSRRSKYKNVLILNMPVIGLNNPPMGPAIIQKVSKDIHMETQFIDLNLELQTFLKNTAIEDEVLLGWCGGLREETVDDTTPEIEEVLNNFFDCVVPDINQFEVIAISVFSLQSQNFTSWFLSKIKNNYNGITVIGGAGVGTPDQKKETYGAKVYSKKLCDYYIIGEGELSFKAIMTGNLPYPGINGMPYESLPNFDSVPLPDYTGFHLTEYLNSKSLGTTIGVEGSRGCVRNCTFCDIKAFWKKYKFKDGKRLASELIEMKSKYQVKHFFFNDSLINGSDKAFRDFITTLAEYNKQNEDQIRWSAYYIIKNKNTYKEQDWIDLKDSGIDSLYIGIESGSEKVRDHMKKKFSDEDIDHAMEKIHRYGIRCTWLMIIGYPTETEEDFNLTLDLLRKYQHMAIDRTIDTLALGFTLGIIEGSPLGEMKEELNIRSMIPEHFGSVYFETDANNFYTRLEWRIKAETVARELGYRSWKGENGVIEYFEKRLEDIKNQKATFNDLADNHG